jgi:hypothetical protein
MVIKSLKSLTLTIAWEIARSLRSGIFGSNLISDSYVTGNHNKTENEVLSFRIL